MLFRIGAFQLCCHAGRNDPFVSYGNEKPGPAAHYEVVFQTESIDAEYEGEFNEQVVLGLVRRAFCAGFEWAQKNSDKNDKT
ncbi:MAG: hypothetical protein AAB731_04940 [Patescibacteria group bacterium]